MTAALPKADAILFFALPVGDEALACGFWGRDVEQAVASASNPMNMKATLMKDMALRLQREKGYRTYQIGWSVRPDLECYLCVRVGFSERIARAIAVAFLKQTDEWTEEWRKGLTYGSQK